LKLFDCSLSQNFSDYFYFLFSLFFITHFSAPFFRPLVSFQQAQSFGAKFQDSSVFKVKHATI
jgi:hypothetical protein